MEAEASTESCDGCLEHPAEGRAADSASPSRREGQRPTSLCKIKQIRSNLNDSRAVPFSRYLCNGHGISVLKRLLEKGLDPNDQDNGGASAIQDCLVSMGCAYQYDCWNREPLRKHIDAEESRDRIKAIHLLAKHGARWIPQEKTEISQARRSLLKLTPDHTFEFVWITSKYRACDQEAIHRLLSTPSIKRQVNRLHGRLREILSNWKCPTSMTPRFSVLPGQACPGQTLNPEPTPALG